ncbi:MAG: hypothetical protein L3J78_00340 [Thermoplasmata archaeon]|nr:hypothetical protein [Thermoplasmata archaeon]
MEPLIVPRGARALNAKLGAAFGILTGIFVLVGFLIPSPAGTPEQQLANYSTDARTWEIIGILDVFVLLAGIPFAAYLRSVLEGKSPGTASAAAILFIIGLVLGAGASAIQVTALGTLASTYTSATATVADRSAAVVAASVLSSISTSLLSIVLLEAGIVLFAVTMLNSRMFANWVADVGVASAVFFLLILVLTPFLSSTSFVGFVVFLAYLALLAIWVFASAGYLLRSARPAKAAAPAAA